MPERRVASYPAKQAVPLNLAVSLLTLVASLLSACLL
jgi:hypothetical protein